MNWKRFAASVFALLAVVLMSHQPARAQANVQAGSIQGVVTDPQGGVVPDAKVTITNKDTGASVDTATTSAGTFTSGSLIPGNYTVRVEAPSFKTVTATYVVQINQVSSATIKLELGASSTVVEVTGQTVSVNTDQAQVSGTLTSQQIENLPVNGRNFLDLAQLEPGVQIQDGANFDPTKVGFSSISFGGRFGRSARISVDGVDVSDENVGTTTTGIPASAISEFQLAQSSLDLSNDLTSSGAVNVATKSGTNSIHGGAFGLFRDSSQAAGFPADAQFQRSQFGGDVGGPIIKDKLFFFIDGERTLQHASAGVLVSPPFNDLTSTFPAPFHETDLIGRVDWQVTKTIHAFGRFSFFQNEAVDSFGGASTFSFFGNRDRTKNVVGGVDFTTGSYTHSFRAEYLKFVNVLGDAVLGSGVPFSDLPVSTIFEGTGLATGPSFLAPQSTIQSDRQVKYDGSKVWGSHIIRYGIGYNRIHGWTFASFLGISPLVINLGGIDPTANLTCPNGDTGAACPLNYTPDIVEMGNGQGSFTELSAFGKSSGGLGPDNRLSAYVGDSWKIKPNLTATIGVRYVRDTGRTDSDLSVPIINQIFPGFGNHVQQPNKNFAPQLGLAWDPKKDGKTVIRAGVGLYYDNIVFNDVLFDRLLKIPTGAFNVTPFGCNGGTAGQVSFPSPTGIQVVGGSSTAGGVVCSSALGATLGANAGNCSGVTTAQCLATFQTSYQTAVAANPTGPNADFLGGPNGLIATGAPIPTAALLDPAYKSPRSVQMNVGIQREIRPGMVITADYIRNVGLHYLLGIDINHTGDAAFLNSTAATSIIDGVNAGFGCPTGQGGVSCSIAHGATITDYANAGLDSPADQGVGSCIVAIGTPCAFGGQNSAVGNLTFLEPIGRSVYNAFDLKWVDNVNHPFRGVKYLNFQFAYSLSRFVNAGSQSAVGGVSATDQDFANNAIDNNNPNGFSGDASLDRRHQFNMGGYADLPAGFRLGIISHFWSPLPNTPSLNASPGAGQIFSTDFTGDGTVVDNLPLGQTSSTCGEMGGTCDYKEAKVGSFMRGLSPGGLNNAISNYNGAIAGQTITPAGQALVNAGLMTESQLIALGATPPTIAGDTQQIGYAWLKSFDVQVSWVGHFWHERLTVIPSVGFFNVFNFANFDSVGNVLNGQLSGNPGAINAGAGQISNATRPDRIGVGSGLFQFGQPRVIEWGLRLQF
jgi:hypothetical protein